MKRMINVTTQKGLEVKVYVQVNMLPTSLWSFKYYIPKKYEISYITGNQVYKNLFVPSPIEGGEYKHIKCGTYSETAKVLSAYYVGRNIKKNGEFVKYVPRLAHVIEVIAMPQMMLSGNIDGLMMENVSEVATELFSKFIKIF